MALLIIPGCLKVSCYKIFIFPQKNYKQLQKWILFSFQEAIPDKINTFKKPGTICKASWIVKLIYAI